ncbi:hypothetical protein CDL15_Pgr008288 [Punica granatum]|uniref:Uncharacterized protein n=1 Tax=Punica granatum TaxID=22663 RepID=A0A218WQS2_PUNGR|nr:hypothetical protein CDL15_Pgr008288 [Punica granatum]
MNKRRRAGSTRKALESGRKNLQAKNPENSGAGIAALFFTKITEAPKGAQYGTLKISLGAKVTNNTHPGTIKAMGEIFGAHSRKTEITAIPGHLKTFGEHGESPSHKSLGSPGPTVFGRGQRANDVPRSKRVTETNVKRHKEQSGTGGSQFHSKRPNKAKAALEAPSRLNVRSYDGWRY